MICKCKMYYSYAKIPFNFNKIASLKVLFTFFDDFNVKHALCPASLLFSLVFLLG